MLLVGGFFRSLQFTGINTLGLCRRAAGADEPRHQPFASMGQQLSQSVGVGTGALLVHLTPLFVKGTTVLGPTDFAPAFLGVALISLGALPIFMRLAPDAGAGMIGGGREAKEADRPGSTGGA